MLLAQGELVEGERAIGELLEASRILGGPSHRDLGLLTLQLGELLMAQQRFTEAAAQFMTSSSAFLLTEGPRSVHYCMAGVDTAEALHASGQFSSMRALAETLVDADAIATLPSMMWKLRAAKVLRLCGSAADAARRLSQFSPGTGETVQWREELAACRWWAGLFNDAYVEWGEAYSHAASSTDLDPVASRIGANLALHELSQGKLAQLNAFLVEAEARADSELLPVLMLTVSFLAGTGKSADWLRSDKGKAFTGRLKSATEEHERRYGRHHPLSGTVRNLWAVALMLGSEWSEAATVLEDSNLESGYGVEGYDLVAATLALNAFLASVVLRRRQPAVTYFERVYRATASCPHHPFRAAADRARLELGVFAEPPPPERVVRALLLLPLA